MGEACTQAERYENCIQQFGQESHRNDNLGDQSLGAKILKLTLQ
jgi:uncharacterized protein (DUF924 family)